MNIHEYQAKELFRQNGIYVPRGFLARSPVEAEFAFKRLGPVPLGVLKAQIHAGGRGKAGGVKLVKTPKEAYEAAGALLHKPLVTHQTDAKGKVVSAVYIEEGCSIKKEYYLAFVLDREHASVGLIFSTAGGMDIEEVAEKKPDLIHKISIDPTLGLRDHSLRQMSFALKIPKEEMEPLHTLAKKLYSLFITYDCSMLEVNPLVLTDGNRFIPLDGKISFDENALYRQSLIASFRDFTEEDPREVEASRFGLSYIGLDGNIGCLVNGAGLAMATMDIIKHYGGEPANFLDVGGGANKDMVREAFRIILEDQNVRGLFVNIFGGIMRCDLIAQSLVEACQTIKLTLPLVVRIEGTNVDEGRKILMGSGIPMMLADNMADGAQKILASVKGK